MRMITKAITVCTLTLPLLTGLGCTSLLVPGTFQGKTMQTAIYRDTTTGDVDICDRAAPQIVTDDATKTFRVMPQPKVFHCSALRFDDTGTAALTITKPPTLP